MNDGHHWLALQYVYKRHVLQGQVLKSHKFSGEIPKFQALMYTDLRERTYVMMNDEKVVIRRRGRCKNVYFLGKYKITHFQTLNCSGLEETGLLELLRAEKLPVKIIYYYQTSRLFKLS